MRNCKDCKYWKGQAVETPAPYSDIENDAGWGYCGKTTQENTLMFREDSELGDLTQIDTRQDFGCVMFEGTDEYQQESKRRYDEWGKAWRDGMVDLEKINEALSKL